MTQDFLERAVAAYHAGNFAEAADISRQALRRVGDEEGLLTVLALSEHASGHYTAAADAFDALTRLRPEASEYWSNRGYMLRLAGRQNEAEAAFQRAIALNPASYDALLNYGLLLVDMNRYGAARHRFLDAVDVDPSRAEARIYAASACFECGDVQRAAELIPEPGTWDALDSETRHDLAMALVRVGRTAEAEQMLDPDALDTSDPNTLARLALLHERTNRLDTAQELFERIRAHPEGASHDAKVDALTVGGVLAMRRKDYRTARALTEELLTLGLSAAGEASSWFTLAAIADKERRPDEAMQHLAKAHAIHLRFAEEMLPEIALSDEEPLRISLERMTAEQCAFAEAGPSDDAVESPVFIVGFPRSGTTMLEQMLDAHPRFVSMDEQPILERCVKAMQGLGWKYPMELGSVSPEGLEQIRSVYWAAAKKVAALSPGQTLVDKNPLNILRLPMIRRIFPGAKIILALRHPCDVMLSCYMQDFRSPAFRVLCSSLERLAGSYANTMRFWLHHAALLKPDVLVLRYEETVSDFPTQVARIAQHLGIEDGHYLEQFSQNALRKGYIGTPSYAQVVEPVNTRAVARWRAYESYFAPVLPLLRPVAKELGYELAPEKCAT